MLSEVATVDAILRIYSADLGRDCTAYRNHVYRVVNFCALLTSPGSEALEKIAITAAFHDLGIWTNGTFDYLRPSIGLASAYLVDACRVAWTTEIAEAIHEHHKISPYRGDPQGLVESFRRADWIDVSRGLRTFGLSRAALAPIFSAWPNAGFHRLLVRLSLTRLRTHPWSPLPMVRL